MMVKDLFGHEIAPASQAKSKALQQSLQRMSVYRQTPEYRQWLIQSREARRSLKEKYRRQKGVKSVEQRKVDAQRAQRDRKERERIERAARHDHNQHVKAWKQARPAAWFRNQYRNNDEFNAKQKLRARLRKALQPDSEVARLLAVYVKKEKWTAGWTELLGYGMAELVVHLRKTIPKRSSWADFLAGDLHIDHIIPRSSFDLTKASEIRACWALSNLRLLRAADNIKKHSKTETLL